MKSGEPTRSESLRRGLGGFVPWLLSAVVIGALPIGLRVLVAFLFRRSTETSGSVITYDYRGLVLVDYGDLAAYGILLIAVMMVKVFAYKRQSPELELSLYYTATFIMSAIFAIILGIRFLATGSADDLRIPIDTSLMNRFTGALTGTTIVVSCIVIAVAEYKRSRMPKVSVSGPPGKAPSDATDQLNQAVSGGI